MRRATVVAFQVVAAASSISTHALREEGDAQFWCCEVAAEKFLPTPSVRRATGQGVDSDQPVVISTHALREEGDKS